MTTKQVARTIIERANLTTASTVQEIIAAVHDARAGSWDRAYMSKLVVKIVAELV